jgi:hypothetical protein
MGRIREASDDQIAQAFGDLEGLLSAEHSEHDDQGARQVGRLIKLLRKFRAHEQSEHAGKPGPWGEDGSAPQSTVATAHAGPPGPPSSAIAAPVTGPFGTSGYREAAYALPDGRQVWYDDGRESLRDAADLYAVLPEILGADGSPNLENLQARHILDRLQTGQGLGEVHIATLRGLLSKHKAKIDEHRRSPDRGGQDMLTLASDGPDARIIPANER